jgi:hypothetical protein
MSKLIDLNIKPIVSHGLTHNVLRVSVDYDKRNTGPVASLQTAECGPPESGFSSFKVAIFGSPSARVSVEKGWKMNNRKRMEAARDQVLSEIIGKRGDTYAAIVKLLADNGSEIVEPTAV